MQVSDAHIQQRIDLDSIVETGEQNNSPSRPIILHIRLPGNRRQGAEPRLETYSEIEISENRIGGIFDNGCDPCHDRGRCWGFQMADGLSDRVASWEISTRSGGGNGNSLSPFERIFTTGQYSQGNHVRQIGIHHPQGDHMVLPADLHKALPYLESGGFPDFRDGRQLIDRAILSKDTSPAGRSY